MLHNFFVLSVQKKIRILFFFGFFSGLMTHIKIPIFLHIFFFCVLFFIFLILSRNLSNQLENLSTEIFKKAETLIQTTEDISKSSQELFTSTEKQASAIQETAASIQELHSMIQSNSEKSITAETISEKTEKIALQEKKDSEEMLNSIEELEKSQKKIVQQTKEGNQQIEEIIKMLSAIENKTQMINDIVFQTKILSFNASVEAARAGENGKGFSVVAEEVGKLAQISGQASEEISSLLKESTKKVEQIILSTQTGVSKLITENKEKIKQSIEISKKCSHELKELLISIKSVNIHFSEISKASQEQTQEVGNMSRSISVIDQNTLLNVNIAKRNSEFAEKIYQQSQDIRTFSSNLSFILIGKNKIKKQSQETKKGISIKPAIEIKKIQAFQSHQSVQKKEILKKPEENLSSKIIPIKREIPSRQDQRFEDV